MGSHPTTTRPLIDWQRIQRVMDECPSLDEYRGYYRQFEVPHRRVGPMVPRTRDLLRQAMQPDMRVLDIGCGHGETLLECAPLFRWGEGIDESAEVMIAHASAEQTRRAIRNVRFRTAKAASLPFESCEFDFVFSERGPLGHNDTTLAEALRVLTPGGMFFIETIGEWNSWETRTAFEPDYVRPPSPTKLLEIERARLERHGVQITSLASRLEALEFPSIEDWVRYQVYSWSPPGREAFCAQNLGAMNRFCDIASSHNGKIRVTLHTLWLAGVKAA